jgi:hypothetical protein
VRFRGRQLLRHARAWIHAYGHSEVRGLWAEEWSIESLRKVGGWLITANLPFQNVDVDHVAITPSGVLAVESKCRNRPFNGEMERSRHERELANATAAARKVDAFLRSENLHALECGRIAKRGRADERSGDRWRAGTPASPPRRLWLSNECRDRAPPSERTRTPWTSVSPGCSFAVSGARFR